MYIHVKMKILWEDIEQVSYFVGLLIQVHFWNCLILKRNIIY